MKHVFTILEYAEAAKCSVIHSIKAACYCIAGGEVSFAWRRFLTMEYVVFENIKILFDRIFFQDYVTFT